MKKIIKKIWPIGILILIVLAFFYKTFQGKILLPGDMLVGAYYPWMEYKNWGYETKVPIKNPLLTDAYSQFFLWKKLIVESYKNHHWPLWNSNSYSGYPLLATFHSGALYILDILFFIPNFNQGWNWFLISGILLSVLSMFLLLKTFKYPNLPSIIGAVSYGFCGYSLSWMQMATAGHSMIYLPLMILILEKYFQSKDIKWLWFLSPLIFLLTTAGHFQILIYGCILCGAYFIFKISKNKKNNKKIIGIFSLTAILGGLMSLIQIWPTLGLTQSSIRSSENVIATLNYGLLPIKNLVTLLAPDYFGNPTTFNYFGVLNYHESLIYAGIAAIIALTWGILNWKKVKGEKFFIATALLTIILCFDNPIAKLIYWLKIPFLSTAGATRIAVLFPLATSVILAKFLSEIKDIKFKHLLKINLFFLVTLGCFMVINYLVRKYYLSLNNEYLNQDIINTTVSMRNLIWPTLLIIAFGIGFLFRRWKIFYLGFLILVLGDLFRFGWKYLPFVPESMIFPKTEVLDYLKKQNGVFRIEKEKGPLLTPNTWSYYNLMSPSGYDPLAVKEYIQNYNQDLNGYQNSVSRYAELDNYPADELGKYNVKYLLALKWENKDKDWTKQINQKIKLTDWNKLIETKETILLENKKYQERARLENPKNNQVKIELYTPNKVEISYKSETNNKLILADTWYPGWTAKVNGQKTEIEKYQNIFRKVSIPKGEGKVEFLFEPKSFYNGLIISVGTVIIWIVGFWFLKKK